MIVTLADPYIAQNAGRRYPLADNTSGLSDTSILDFRCTLREGISDVVPTATLTALSDEVGERHPVRRITVTLTSGNTVHGTLSFDFPMNRAVRDPFTAVATSSGLVGSLTVSESVFDEATGAYAIPFSPATIICHPLSVDSIQAVTDTAVESAVLTGAITLDSGYNAEPYLDGQNLRLDIYKGAGRGEWCQQAASGQTCENVLFTINGERPGSDGELHLVGENGITVTPDAAHNALEIKIDSVATDRMSKTCGTVC